MEVKIGVQHIVRELVIDTTMSQEEVSTALTKALKDDGLLTLSDDKGRKLVVPAARIAYLEVASSEVRRVGFGTS